MISLLFLLGQMKECLSNSLTSQGHPYIDHPNRNARRRPLVRVLLRVDLCSSTIVGVALADDIVAVLVGTSQVLAPTDVGHPSFPYSVPCSSCRLDIVPSGSSVAPGS